ncbi:MAG TPA: histidine kinase, partial [Acidobacteriota bacterium]|nr:histidine kinase [Acidobacteriota bacterium]
WRGGVLAWELAGWYIWGLLSPVIFWLARRFPLERRVWPMHFSIHAGLSLLFAAIHLILHYEAMVLMERTIYTPLYLTGDFSKYLFARFTWRIMVYFIVLIACHALDWQRRYHEEQQIASQLKTQLAMAQLEALKMQLHPHFFFNALHSISELMHHDIRAADNMMVRLADFLRLTLANSGSQQIPLEKELEFLQCYLEIEQVRFRDRLHVVLKIDEQTRTALVPNLILQPIVENAIRHGIAQRSAQGIIEISAGISKDMLRIQVKDNGPGLSPDHRPEDLLNEGGLGLSNTNDRLFHLYGMKQRFEIAQPSEGGVQVTIELPLTYL